MANKALGREENWKEDREEASLLDGDPKRLGAAAAEI